MTPVTLHKLHGLGNDFLVLFADDTDLELGDAPLAELARRVCARRRGIGADGLLVASGVTSSTPVSATMVLYNADGSRAEMSGNGIRCFAHAVARRVGSFGRQVVHTDAGDRALTVSATDDPDSVAVRVSMGSVEPLGEPAGWAATECHPDRPVAHVSLGNPHSVVGVDDVAVVDLAMLGGRVPHVNLEIVEPGPGPTEVTMRVHERGVGITEACGTGASAAAYAARSWGLVPATTPSVTVHMPGGPVTVELIDHERGTDAVLTGPSTYVAAATCGAAVATPIGTR